MKTLLHLLLAGVLLLMGTASGFAQDGQRADMCTAKTATLTETRANGPTATATLTVTNPCDDDRLLVKIATESAEFDFGCYALEIHQPIVQEETDDWRHHRHIYRGHGMAGLVDSWPDDANGYVTLHYPGNRGGACPSELKLKEGNVRQFWISFDLNRVDNSKPFAPLEPFQVMYDEEVVLTFP